MFVLPPVTQSFQCFNVAATPRLLQRSLGNFGQRSVTQRFNTPSWHSHVPCHRCHNAATVAASLKLNSQASDLQSVSESFGLTNAQVTNLSRLTDLVVTGNQSLNLTGIKTADQIIVKHIFDAFTLLPTLDTENPRRIIDVGSGAGFPGFVLAIVRPDIHVTLLECARKKTFFHEQVISDLSLENVDSVWARAEEAGQDVHRERYCLAVARSVAPMTVLSELVLPLVRVGGVFIAQKSVEPEHSEINAAKPAIAKLGGSTQSITPVWAYDSTGSTGQAMAEYQKDNRHNALVIVRKVHASPSCYPRLPGVPKKAPLR